MTAPGPGLPRSVWAMGVVSLLMDTSSELIHSLLPLFMVVSLGASAAIVGLVEGIAEATAAFVRIASGALSDWQGRRKPLAVLGYAVAAAAKMLFPLATSVPLVAAARFADRVGKGIRGAPRDALIADITPLSQRGRAFGLRQALDSVGAVAGPLLAIALMLALAGDARAVFWVAALPAWAAVAVLVFAVAEPPRQAPAKPQAAYGPWRLLSAPFWTFLGVTAAIGLARFGEAFLILAGSESGLGAAWAPLVLAIMSVTYALASYPAGWLADRRGHAWPLAVGLLVLAIADLVLALAHSVAWVLVGAALWGLHMGLTQGQLAAQVAAIAAAEARGTAFGLFNATSGLSLLAASVLVGLLWDAFGSATAFAAGAGIAVVALAGLGAWQQAYRAGEA